MIWQLVDSFTQSFTPFFFSLSPKQPFGHAVCRVCSNYTGYSTFKMKKMVNNGSSLFLSLFLSTIRAQRQREHFSSWLTWQSNTPGSTQMFSWLPVPEGWSFESVWLAQTDQIRKRLKQRHTMTVARVAFSDPVTKTTTTKKRPNRMWSRQRLNYFDLWLLPEGQRGGWKRG